MWRGFIPRPFYMIELWEYVYILKAGETIIMPAKKPHAVYGKERFKMLLNVVFLNAYSRLKIKLQYQDLKSVFIESISVNTDFFWRKIGLVS